MTALDLIRRALRLAGVLDANEAPEAEDAEDALDVLNALFAEWRGAGIMITDFDVADPDADLSISAADREAIAHQLTKRLAPEYGVSLSGEFASNADESWRRLEHRYFQVGKISHQELPTATSDCESGFDINTGWC